MSAQRSFYSLGLVETRNNSRSIESIEHFRGEIRTDVFLPFALRSTNEFSVLP